MITKGRVTASIKLVLTLKYKHMGWTSFTYTDAEHLTFTPIKAYDFCRTEFQRNNYKIIDFYLEKAQDINDKNVVYLVMQHPEGYNFIMVVLIDIEKDEIFYKEITASMGPTKTNCPIEFLEKVPIPEANTFEYKWFIDVRKSNVKYKKQVEIIN